MKVSRQKLSRLYLADETAWLEELACLIGQRKYDLLDYKNLREYLQDMARRDRREVFSRLVTLLAHRLKWDYEPRKRPRSWKLTILEQQRELELDFESKTLRNHAQDVLAKAYGRAVMLAAAQTGLPESAFPQECPYTLDGLLASNWEHPHD
jgi:hypothetical protein